MENYEAEREENMNYGSDVRLSTSIEVLNKEEDIMRYIRESEENLQKLKRESEKKEAKIIKQTKDTLKKWECQATETQLIDRALEYKQSAALDKKKQHTFNKWVTRGELHTISNMVYIGEYRISKDKDFPKYYMARYRIRFNVPPLVRERLPFITCVAEMKYYIESQAEARLYIQQIIDKYEKPFFGEIIPPILDKYSHLFKMYGVLLPGYTIIENSKGVIKNE